MIIQRVIKGISNISTNDARGLADTGIVCNWWRAVNPLPQDQVPSRLTEQNLDWHQNRYDDPDPNYGNAPFREHTPFISTTAGTVIRDVHRLRNHVQTAKQVALSFAMKGGNHDGYLFYCYLFVLGRSAVSQQPFAEELRELNVYSSFSAFQPEGEITAKIIIPPAQIEKYEFYSRASWRAALAVGTVPNPDDEYVNVRYSPPADISNMRGVLA